MTVDEGAGPEASPDRAGARGQQRSTAMIRAGAAAVLARGGTSVTALLLVPVLARLLGVEAYGVLLTLTTTSSLLLLGNLGIGAGLVSRLGRADSPLRARTVLSSAYAVVVAATIVGVLVVGVLAVALPWSSWTSAAGVSAADIRWCAFIAMVGAVLQVTTGLGQQIELSQQRGHVAAWWLGAANIGAAVVATGLAVLTRDLLWTIAGLSLTPPVVMAVQSVLSVRRLPAAWRPTRAAISRSTVRELFSSGSHFTGLAVLGALAFQLDILIVSAFLGSDSAAVYGVTTRLFGLVSVTIQVAVTQLWSAVADAQRHGDVGWVRSALRRTTTWCAAIGVSVSLLLLVSGSTVIELWVGPSFVPPVALLAAAATWTALVSAAAPLVFYLNGIKKEREQFLVSIPMTIANVGLSIWLVQVIGISGVLWASCIAWVVFVLVPLSMIARRSLVDDVPAPSAVTTDAGSTDEAVGPDPSTPRPPAATAPTSTKDADYRPDVDGLRAVAVLAVVGFHYFPGSFPGGFVGVDVFFVVSGFLITGLLVRRIGLGTFTIGDFYARRVRRIFPALGLVVVVSLAAGWVVLFSDEFRSLAGEAAAGSFFVANFHFMQEASYFDANAYTKPLLHLWSLAIEEQFYLVWPIIMVLALRRTRRFALVVLALLTVVSFALNLYLVRLDPSSAYYSPFSRFWQLSAGGLLAMVPWGQGLRNRWIATTTSAAGLFLIAVSVLGFSSALAYPGPWAAVPVIGALAVIAAGSSSWLNRRLLSWRAAVGIGLISYPLYLWHWPLISFTTIVERQFPAVPTRLGLVLVAFVLAIATYRLVERPLRLRFSPRQTWRPLAGAVVAAGLAAVFIAGPIGPPSANSADSATRGVVDTWPFETDRRCDDRYPFDDKVGGWWFCVTNADQDPNILLLGDSTANELYPGLVTSFPGSTVLSIGTCPPTRGVTFRPLAPTPGNPCFQPRSVEQERFIDRTIGDLDAPWVVLNTIWPRFDADGRWIDEAGRPAGTIEVRSGGSAEPSTDRAAMIAGLDARISSIESAGGRVVLVGPKPQIGYDVTQCFPRPFNESVRSCSIPRAVERDQYRSFAQVADAVRLAHPSVEVFDQSSAYCTTTTCSLVADGRPLMRDQVHLSVIGSRLVGREFSRWATDDAPGFGR